ncbi:MAG: N-glycosylase/DNA lyase [Candidatus Woesearchaeota archaeon]
MDVLIGDIRSVMADPTVSSLVEERMASFTQVRDDSDERLFLELCFCLLTANFQSEKSMIIHDAIGRGFVTHPEHVLAKRLRSLGYRFPNIRARFIVEARVHVPKLRSVVYGDGFDEAQRREWLVSNVKGLGLKEASHYLRNVGVPAFPIIDRHIVAILAEHGLVSDPDMPITKKRYALIEAVMDALARDTGLDHGRLDFYVWYLKTGRVLK